MEIISQVNKLNVSPEIRVQFVKTMKDKKGLSKLIEMLNSIIVSDIPSYEILTEDIIKNKQTSIKPKEKIDVKKGGNVNHPKHKILNEIITKKLHSDNLTGGSFYTRSKGKLKSIVRDVLKFLDEHPEINNLITVENMVKILKELGVGKKNIDVITGIIYITKSPKSIAFIKAILGDISNTIEALPTQNQAKISEIFDEMINKKIEPSTVDEKIKPSDEKKKRAPNAWLIHLNKVITDLKKQGKYVSYKESMKIAKESYK